MKVNINKLTDLKNKLSRLEKTYGDYIAGATSEVNSIANTTNSKYHESYVRSASCGVLQTSNEVKRSCQSLTQLLQGKAKGLDKAIGIYKASEEKTKGNKISVNINNKRFLSMLFASPISIPNKLFTISMINPTLATGRSNALTNKFVNPQSLGRFSGFVNGTATGFSAVEEIIKSYSNYSVSKVLLQNYSYRSIPKSLKTIVETNKGMEHAVKNMGFSIVQQGHQYRIHGSQGITRPLKLATRYNIDNVPKYNNMNTIFKGYKTYQHAQKIGKLADGIAYAGVAFETLQGISSNIQNGETRWSKYFGDASVDVAVGAARIYTVKGGIATGSSFGAAIGTFFCPGIGTAIGAAVGAIGGGLITGSVYDKIFNYNYNDKSVKEWIQLGVKSSVDFISNQVGDASKAGANMATNLYNNISDGIQNVKDANMGKVLSQLIKNSIPIRGVPIPNLRW
ncbi:hypothetical protein [Alkaliphilus transvaalensis]|uniref:hypothetical protein n=1 Tax=Alkaliphilus transvaalensis TaxID=114628 RepID=UPI0006841111|nr:hypothetical protein [Alkaliphilus transvaalensis]